VLSGGLIIGAFFMATDMVTTPVTPTGRAIFAAGCGLLVSLIRRYGGYPEGVAYSIVLMNTATPLIDRWVRPRIYGSTTPKSAPRGT
jgi:electron transport complex protein RnfD